MIKTILFSVALIFSIGLSAQEYQPYNDFGNLDGEIASAASKIKSTLKNAGFEFKGSYSPENKSTFQVLVFSRKDLKQTCLKTNKQLILAAALKVALTKKEGIVAVSAINPTYLFMGYFRDAYDAQKEVLQKVTSDFNTALKGLGNTISPFGGELSEKNLKKYHYMMGMPYFDDMVKLKEFASFEEGYKMITDNLSAGKGNTKLVYKFNYESIKVASFGVGLLDAEKGEANFLPIIGEKHIAAMPYDLLLIGNTAYTLHGRFRFAFYWPELTMGTFTKIMSTPGNVADFMKGLTEK